MAQQIINSTDVLNVGRIKINDNFTELYSLTGSTRLFADDTTVNPANAGEGFTWTAIGLKP